MPDRSRHARRTPPSAWDHVLSHPVEVAAALWWAVLGAIILIGLLPGLPGISSGIDKLPWPVAAGLALAVGGGGVLTILGVCWPGDYLTTAWRLERTGLIFAAVGWASYGVILFNSRSIAVFTLSMCLAMITGAILRLIATWGVDEKDARQDISDAGMAS